MAFKALFFATSALIFLSLISSAMSYGYSYGYGYGYDYEVPSQPAKPNPPAKPSQPAKPSPPPVKPSQPAYSSKASQYLAPHNAARQAIGVRPLVWDTRLEAFAQWWASQRRYDCELQHSDGPYGENIFWGSGVGWTPGQAVSAWVDERSRYSYGSNSCRGGSICGHYTQIVWRGTQRIGCASIACAGGKGTFITCNYDPPGNYIGERPY